MSSRHTHHLLMPLLAAGALIAGGCGGHSSSKRFQTNPGATQNQAVISGKVAGVDGARVEVYAITPATRALRILGAATAAADGTYSVSVQENGPFLVMARGGSFVDPATGNQGALGNPPADPANFDADRSNTFEAIVADGATGALTVNLSAATTFVSRRLAEELRTNAQALQATNVDLRHGELSDELGLTGPGAPVDPRAVEPLAFDDAANAAAIAANPQAPEALLGAIVAGLSEQAQGATLTNPMDLVEALAADYADGAFDGAMPSGTAGSTTEIRVGGSPLAVDAGTARLSAAATAFLNGNARNASGLDASGFTALITELGATSVASTINRPPTFAPTLDLAAVAAVATDVTLTAVAPGPASEAGQTVTVTATSSDPAVVPTPTVAGNVITITAAAAGTATITVTVQDDGATLNGGWDAFSRTFVVTATAGPVGPTTSISSAVPGLASSLGGTTITVVTAGFSEDFTNTAPTATVGGVTAQVTVVDATTITLDVPQGLTAGTAALEVTTPTATAALSTFEIVAPITAGELVINEFMANPNAGGGNVADANGDGASSTSQDEFVELVNARSSAVDLSGFTIEDGFGLRHTFPNPTTLPAGGAIVVFGGGTPTGFAAAHATGHAQVASSNLLGLNNGGDSITIKDVNGTTIATFTYTSADVSGGASTNRGTDGDANSAFAIHNAVAGAAGDFSPGNQANGNAFP